MPITLVIFLVAILENTIANDVSPCGYKHEILELASLFRLGPVLHVVSRQVRILRRRAKYLYHRFTRVRRHSLPRDISGRLVSDIVPCKRYGRKQSCDRSQKDSTTNYSHKSS